MQPLFYLPGFNSGPQSEKSVLLQQQFPGITIPIYDTWNPDKGFSQLNAVISPVLAHNPILIGSSLGGFWAYHFASKYGLRCLLLNPCMTPEVSLKYAVGNVKNFYTNETGTLTLEDLLRYPNYRFAPHPRFNPLTDCNVLHEKGDETIPYEESIENFAGKAKLVLFEGGHHRFDRLDVIITEIKAICEQHH